MNDQLRVFIAIELPPAVKVALQAQIDALRGTTPPRSVAWVNAENVHLTLKFLGNVPLKQLEEIKEATHKAASDGSGFSLTVVGLGCFPNVRRPKVIWVGLDGEQTRLMALRDRVESCVAPLGYPTDNRPFSPHLTLGRVKTSDTRTLVQIGDLIKQTQVGRIVSWACDRVSVMQSTLKPSGAVYTELAHFEL